MNNLENRLRQSLEDSAAPMSIRIEDLNLELSGMGSSRRRRWLLFVGASLSAAAIVLVGGILLGGGHTDRTGNTAATQPGAATQPNGGVSAHLGPGCIHSFVSLVASGASQRDGRPLLAGAVGKPLVLTINLDPGLPYLNSTATVVVAVPGTHPGVGFADPRSASDAASIDQRQNWVSSVSATPKAVTDTELLSFTPTQQGLFPIYALERSASNTASPPMCGGVPDRGGSVEAVVGWVDISG